MSKVGSEPLIMRHNSDALYKSVGLCNSDTPELVKKATYDAGILLKQGSISESMHMNYLHQLDYLTTDFKRHCTCQRKSKL